MRAYAGPSPHFDEAATRETAAADVARTLDLAAAMTNHLVMAVDGPRRGGLADIAVPTIVVHGALDPAYPMPHGRRLADTIPGARLLVLPDTGHDPVVARDLVVVAGVGGAEEGGHRVLLAVCATSASTKVG